MAEYIEREALVNKISENKLMVAGAPAAKRILGIISEFPAADVEPVRHGRWLAIDEWMTDECSNCGARINIEEFDDCSYHPKDGNIRLNYCPNCGAKMDGGEDNDRLYGCNR